MSNSEAKRCVRLLEQVGLFRSAELQLEAVLLAAQALASLGEWQSVLTLLEDPHHYTMHMHMHNSNNNNNNNNTSFAHPSTPLEDDDDIAWQNLAQHIPKPDNYIHPLSRLCCWRGRAYAETGHPLRAALYWKRALRLDPLCIQALDSLLERSVVPPDQALEVLLQLEFPRDMEWLRALYLARVHVAAPTSSSTNMATDPTTTTAATTISSAVHDIKTDDPFWQDTSSIQLLTPIPQTGDLSSDKLFFGKDEPPSALPSLKKNTTNNNTNNNNNKAQEQVESALDTLMNTHKLDKSSEVLAMAAKRAFRRYNLRHALQYCQELAAVDPLCQTAGFVYVSTLVALGHKRPLFRLAHEWVDAAPKSARAWFAVGAYYYTCQRYHVAQRHFCRATRLDPHCAEAWIAFGTSFAACDESDQALASFRAAQRLAPGDYTSLLYIGMEYLRTNHLTLAQHFLQAAHQSSNGADALCRNELGVLCMAQKNYDSAIRWFVKALGGDSNDHAKDEQLLASLLDTITDVYWEPTLFNLGQAYRKSRAFGKAVLCLERCLTLKESASAYAALAFCKHLLGDLDGAIDTYHQSLSRKPDDPFCSEMLHRALQDALEQTHLFDDPTTTTTTTTTTTATIATDPHRHHHHDVAAHQHPPTPNRRMRPPHDQSASYMTEDGLSISVESSSSDVDMG
jgi:anaphase-promoting complex subunit 6